MGCVHGAGSALQASARACSSVSGDAGSRARGPRGTALAGGRGLRLRHCPRRMHMRPCHRQPAQSTQARPRLARVECRIAGVVGPSLTTAVIVIGVVECGAYLSACSRDVLCANGGAGSCAARLECCKCGRLQLNVQFPAQKWAICQCPLESMPSSAHAAVTKLVAPAPAPARHELPAHADPPQASTRTGILDVLEMMGACALKTVMMRPRQGRRWRMTRM